MSSKTQSQQQQQMPWRSATKQHKSQEKQQSTQPQQQQQSSSSSNGRSTNGNNKDKTGSGKNGVILTPTARSTTAKGPTMSASPFDAANNMMPNFARSQQQYQQPQQPSQQQQSYRPPGYVKKNSLERIDSNNDIEARKQETDNQKQDQQPQRPFRQQQQQQHRSKEDLREKFAEEETEKRRSQSPRDIASPQQQQNNETMGKNHNRKSNSGTSTPRNATPTPPPPTSTTPTPPEQENGAETKQVEMALTLPEEVIKHPLKNKWAMWYFKNDKSKDWKENQRYVFSFDTVEDFWALYNHLVLPSELQSGCDYSLFKEGITPMWEDPKNVDGGRWLINSLKQQRQYVLDRIWMETLLCLVGEAFEDASEEVCGTVINIRPKGDKLAIWTRNAEEQDKNLAVGKGLRERLGLPKQMQLGFQVHKDTITKYGSITRNKYIA